MEMIKRLEPLSLLLVMVVALNWAIDAVFDWNAVSEIFGSGTVADVLYVVAGLAALTFIPKLMDELHVGGHGAHPRGTGPEPARGGPSSKSAAWASRAADF
jgi:uncharacterized membrane protein YuzA (DUF378 family)